MASKISNLKTVIAKLEQERNEIDESLREAYYQLSLCLDCDEYHPDI
jgi:hypothetical protein